MSFFGSVHLLDRIKKVSKNNQLFQHVFHDVKFHWFKILEHSMELLKRLPQNRIKQNLGWVYAELFRTYPDINVLKTLFKNIFQFERKYTKPQLITLPLKHKIKEKLHRCRDNSAKGNCFKIIQNQFFPLLSIPSEFLFSYTMAYFILGIFVALKF